MLISVRKVCRNKGTSLTQHEDSLEDGEHCAHHYAVLGRGEQMAIAGRPYTNGGFFCRGIKDKPRNNRSLYGSEMS